MLANRAGRSPHLSPATPSLDDVSPIPQRWQSEAYRVLTTKVEHVVGGATAKALSALNIESLGDLLRHLPRRYLSSTDLSDLSELQVGEEVAVLARVSHSDVKGAPPRQRLEILLSDGRDRLPVTFFARKKQHLDWWQSQLRVGVTAIVTGKVGEFNDKPQMAHPDYAVLDESGQISGGSVRNRAMGRVTQSGGLIGIYPASSKISTWEIAESARLALDHVRELPDPWPNWVFEEGGYPTLAEALVAVHQPHTRQEAELAHERLRFDEAFAVQLTMAHRRRSAQTGAAVARPAVADGLLSRFDQTMPFALTEGQQQVSDEIFADLNRPHPMQRLLQGDVGSGKTIVALRAMLRTVEAGGQAVLLAPTEVLAAQHYRTITGLLGTLGQGGTLTAAEHATEVVLLTGSMSAAAKKRSLLAAASGSAGIVIGTHAVLSRDVQFAELGLVVIDEQHRFGVEQRAALNAKAQYRPHLLVMTATPIPQSVAITLFGDLDVSTLRELPAGRAEITTTAIDAEAQPAWVARAWERIREEVTAGHQAYVVCPRIHDRDTTSEGHGGGATVVDTYAELSEGPLAGLRIAMLHGQLPSEEKDATMQAFAAGEIDVLVATTVIEVGVDVPNATMMVIRDADRFGISQLHQLRGRIGRGGLPGLCLLMTSAETRVIGRHGWEATPIWQRMTAVADTRDGFALAEIDLAQRREGDILGTNQSGRRSSLRLLSVVEHADLVVAARDLAERAVVEDPDLETPGFADAVVEVEDLMQEVTS